MRLRDSVNRGNRGAIAVEFGIFAPVLLLLIAGIVYFAYAYHLQVTLTSAAREGVRVYALGSGDVVGVTTSAAATAVTPGSVSVSATGCPDPLSPPQPPPQAMVTASYEYAPSPAFMPAITITGQAVMRCGG